MSDCGEKVKELAARKIRSQFGVKSVDLTDKYPVIEAEFVRLEKLDFPLARQAQILR